MATLPRVIVTGASGFLGRRVMHLLSASHHVIAVDRRTRTSSEVAAHPNVEWHAIDVADEAAVRATLDKVRAEGGAAAVIHLAAWYDFTGEAHPEYMRTNVDGTRLLLENCGGLGLRRFIFASSIAACGFSSTGHPITESSPPDGTHIYARSKRMGEELVREHSGRIPTCIVRLAALYSDWCEYPMLYVMLDAWLSKRWNARVLGGQGRTSIPYLHVRDAADFFLKVLDHRDALEPAEVLQASSDGAVSHRQLYDATTEYFFNTKQAPILVPRPLALVGMLGRDTLGRMLGARPFERPWMARYIDTELVVDASRTRERLSWEPRTRLSIVNRIPFMIENLKTNPMEWLMRNREILDHSAAQPNFVIYRILDRHQPAMEEAYGRVLNGEGGVNVPGYRARGRDENQLSARITIRALIQSVRTGERGHFMNYCRDVSTWRANQHIDGLEMIQALRALNWIVIDALRGDPDGATIGRSLHDYVTMTIEFGIDQILEVYEDARAGAQPAA